MNDWRAMSAAAAATAAGLCLVPSHFLGGSSEEDAVMATPVSNEVAIMQTSNGVMLNQSDQQETPKIHLCQPYFVHKYLNEHTTFSASSEQPRGLDQLLNMVNNIAQHGKIECMMRTTSTVPRAVQIFLVSPGHCATSKDSVLIRCAEADNTSFSFAEGVYAAVHPITDHEAILQSLQYFHKTKALSLKPMKWEDNMHDFVTFHLGDQKTRTCQMHPDDITTQRLPSGPPPDKGNAILFKDKCQEVLSVRKENDLMAEAKEHDLMAGAKEQSCLERMAKEQAKGKELTYKGIPNSTETGKYLVKTCLLSGKQVEDESRHERTYKPLAVPKMAITMLKGLPTGGKPEVTPDRRTQLAAPTPPLRYPKPEVTPAPTPLTKRGNQPVGRSVASKHVNSPTPKRSPMEDFSDSNAGIELMKDLWDSNAGIELMEDKDELKDRFMHRYGPVKDKYGLINDEDKCGLMKEKSKLMKDDDELMEFMDTYARTTEGSLLQGRGKTTSETDWPSTRVPMGKGPKEGNRHVTPDSYISDEEGVTSDDLGVKTRSGVQLRRPQEDTNLGFEEEDTAALGLPPCGPTETGGLTYDDRKTALWGTVPRPPVGTPREGKSNVPVEQLSRTRKGSNASGDSDTL